MKLALVFRWRYFWVIILLVLLLFGYNLFSKKFSAKSADVTEAGRTIPHALNLEINNKDATPPDSRSLTFKIRDKPHEVSGNLPNDHIKNLKTSIVSKDRLQYINADKGLIEKNGRFTANGLNLRDNTEYVIYTLFYVDDNTTPQLLRASYGPIAKADIPPQQRQLTENKTASWQNIQATILELPNDGGGVTKLSSKYESSVALSLTLDNMDYDAINTDFKNGGKAVAIGPNMEYVQLRTYTNPADNISILGFNTQFPVPGFYYLYVNPTDDPQQILTFILNVD